MSDRTPKEGTLMVEDIRIAHTLYLIRGLPGVGKSSLAERLQVQHVEADMFHIVDGVYAFDLNRIKEAHEWCQTRARQMLADGDVVVSNTFTTRWEIAPYYDIAAVQRVPARVCEITITSRLTDADLAARTVHSVPVETIRAMRERWEA
jgi:predicted kinase